MDYVTKCLGMMKSISGVSVDAGHLVLLSFRFSPNFLSLHCVNDRCKFGERENSFSLAARQGEKVNLISALVKQRCEKAHGRAQTIPKHSRRAPFLSSISGFFRSVQPANMRARELRNVFLVIFQLDSPCEHRPLYRCFASQADAQKIFRSQGKNV